MSTALQNLVGDMRRRYEVLEQSCPSCVPPSQSPHRTRRSDGSYLIDQHNRQQQQFGCPSCCNGGGVIQQPPVQQYCCANVIASSCCCCNLQGGGDYSRSVVSPPRMQQRHVTVVSPSSTCCHHQQQQSQYGMTNNNNSNHHATVMYSQGGGVGGGGSQYRPTRAQDALSTQNSFTGHFEALSGGGGNANNNNTNSRSIADGVLRNLGIGGATYDPNNYAAPAGGVSGGGGGASHNNLNDLAAAEEEEEERRRRNLRASQRRAANGGDTEVDEKTEQLRQKFNSIQDGGDAITADELKSILAILRRKGPSSVPDQQRLFDAATKAAGGITDHSRPSHVLNVSRDDETNKNNNQTPSTNAHTTSATHSKYYNVIHSAEQNSRAVMPKATDVMQRISEHMEGPSATTAFKYKTLSSSGMRRQLSFGAQKGRAAGQTRQSKIDEAGALSSLPHSQTAILYNSAAVRVGGRDALYSTSSPRRTNSALRGSSGNLRAPIPSDVRGLGIRTSFSTKPLDHPQAFSTDGGKARAPITHERIAGAAVVFSTGVNDGVRPSTIGTNFEAASLAPSFVTSNVEKHSRRRVLKCTEDVRREQQSTSGVRTSSAGRGATERAPTPNVKAGSCIPITDGNNKRASSATGRRMQQSSTTTTTIRSASAIRKSSKEPPFGHPTRGLGSTKPNNFITTLYDTKGIRVDPNYHGPEGPVPNPANGRSSVHFSFSR